MWISLPFAIFFAAYAATTVGFVLSQAAFTVDLIIVFNLISPAGWQVGLVRIEPRTAAAIVTAGNNGMLAADALAVVANDLGFRAEACSDSAAAIRAQVRAILAQITSLADRLEHGRQATGGEKPVSAQALRAAAIVCLDRADGEPTAVRSALALVSAREWAENLVRLETDLDSLVSAAAAAARIPWWR